MSRYIDKVLSHVKGKARRNEVEAELGDHLLFIEDHFEEIGYDREAAESNADERMGDPDLVGEQLNRLLKKQSAFNYVLLALSIICALFCFVSKFFVEDGAAYYHNSVFAPFAAVWIIYVITMSVLTISVKRSHPVASLIAAIGVCLLVRNTTIIANTPVLLLEPDRLFIIFFNNGAYDWTYYYFPDDVMNYGVMIAFYLFALIPACVSLFSSIRTRNLKNTKVDLLLKKLCAAFLAIVVIASAGAISWVALTAFSKQHQAIVEAHDAIIKLDDLVFENLEIIFGEDDKAAVEFLEENAPEGSKFVKNYWEEAARRERSATLIYNGVTMTLSYNEGGIYYLDISPNITGLNGKTPEIFTDSERASAADFKGDFPSAPRPCMIELGKDDGSIKLKYASDYYASGKYIKYSFENNKTQFSESTFESGKPVKLSSKQKKLLKAALLEYAKNKNCERYLEYEGEAFIKIFGVSYDEPKDEYKVDMFFNPEWTTTIDGKLFELSLDDYYTDYCSFTVRFADNEAEIVSSWKPTGIENYRDVFSEQANKNGERWRGFNNYLYNLLKRHEIKYGHKVYGTITVVDDDGTIHYQRYSNYDISTARDENEEIIKWASSFYGFPVSDEEQTLTTE